MALETEHQSSVTFEFATDLRPISPVHVSVHLKVCTHPDFLPKTGETEAFQKMIDTMNEAINNFKAEIRATEKKDEL